MTATYRTRTQQSAVIGLVVAATLMAGCRTSARRGTVLMGRPVAVLRSIARPAPPARRVVSRPSAPAVAAPTAALPTVAAPPQEYFPEPAADDDGLGSPVRMEPVPSEPVASAPAGEAFSEPPDAPKPPADEVTTPMVPDTPDVPAVPDFEMPVRTPADPPSLEAPDEPADGGASEATPAAAGKKPSAVDPPRLRMKDAARPVTDPRNAAEGGDDAKARPVTTPKSASATATRGRLSLRSFDAGSKKRPSADDAAAPDRMRPLRLQTAISR